MHETGVFHDKMTTERHHVWLTAEGIGNEGEKALPGDEKIPVGGPREVKNHFQKNVADNDGSGEVASYVDSWGAHYDVSWHC